MEDVMRTFDCFTDKRTYPIVITPPRTARAQAFIDAQRPTLGPANAPFQGDGLENAAKAWLAHVHAGRIGEGVR
jgi:hypothetical protein